MLQDTLYTVKLNKLHVFHGQMDYGSSQSRKKLHNRKSRLGCRLQTHPVREEDLPLQYFHWLSRDFVELMLVFGAASSTGLYDRLAKTMLDFVVRYSNFPPEIVIQYLDDVCGAAPHSCHSLAKFIDAYRIIATDLGVQLAPQQIQIKHSTAQQQ
jgi:hypothetical protein